MRFLVLGAGAQGSAAALDLARTPGVDRVVLADVDVEHPREFLKPYIGKPIELRSVDATTPDQVRSVMHGVDAVACALPYYFNLDVARYGLITHSQLVWHHGALPSLLRWQMASPVARRVPQRPRRRRFHKLITRSEAGRPGARPARGP